MKEQKLFKNEPGGLLLHAGRFRGNFVWHSDDGGNTWWSGSMFSPPVKVTREELLEMAMTIKGIIMKVQQEKRPFTPITIEFENQQEAKIFWDIINKLDFCHFHPTWPVKLNKQEYELVIRLSTCLSNGNISI